MSHSLEARVSRDPKGVTVSFCGEVFSVDPDVPFIVGRVGDLEIDDNPYLHRHFLSIYREHGMWWIENVGTRLTATVVDSTGVMQSCLDPGIRLPLIFTQLTVVFKAGLTTYEFDVEGNEVLFTRTMPALVDVMEPACKEIKFTPSQLVLMVALAEPLLLHPGSSPADIPPSAAAARRLGWPQTKFNRKLDNVCCKLDRLGVRGLRGEAGKQATNRRARLVEYAIASHIVTRAQLPLLDEEWLRNEHAQSECGTAEIAVVRV